MQLSQAARSAAGDSPCPPLCWTWACACAKMSALFRLIILHSLTLWSCGVAFRGDVASAEVNQEVAFLALGPDTRYQVTTVFEADSLRQRFRMSQGDKSSYFTEFVGFQSLNLNHSTFCEVTMICTFPHVSTSMCATAHLRTKLRARVLSSLFKTHAKLSSSDRKSVV